MKTYNIIDTSERNAVAELHRYTWEQVLDYFRPDAELVEDCQKYEDIKDVSDLREFLAWQQNGMAVHYEIKEGDDVETLEDVERWNRGITLLD